MTNGLTIIKANRYFKNDTQDANIIAKHKKGNRASKRKLAKFLHFVMARCICTRRTLYGATLGCPAAIQWPSARTSESDELDG
jgi:hypothetical protein